MKKLSSFTAATLLMLVVFVGLEVVQADSPPTIPSSFFGEVQFVPGDFVPVPGVTQIDAYIDDGLFPAASKTINQSGMELIYAINVPADTSNLQPMWVVFKIDDRIVATAPWVSGINVNMDIHPPFSNAGGPYIGLAGEEINLSGSATDVGGDISIFAWNLDNGVGFDDAIGQNPAASFTAGVHTIFMKSTDAQGGEGFAETNVIAITIGGLTGQEYDGTPKSVMINNVDPYTTLITYAGSETIPTYVGTYAVEITIKDGDVILGTISGYDLVINPRPITVSGTEDSKFYDGDVTSSASPTITTGSLLTGDTANFIQNFDNKHAGVYKTLMPSGSVDDRNNGANYDITFIPVTTGTIQPRQLTVTAVTDTKVYDGTIVSDGIPNLSEPLDGGDIGQWIQSFDTASAGTGKTLTPRGTIADGNEGNNYAVTYINNITGVVTPRSITVTADVKTKVFGSEEPILTYLYTGELVSDDAFDGDLSREPGESIGTYTILQGNLTLGPNYTIVYVPANFTITVVEYVINLVSGWNLVSFNLNPESTAINDVLSSIEGSYDLIYAWDASGAHITSGNWMKYDPGTTLGRTLNNLEPSMGFWIHMTAADTLTITGSFQNSTTIEMLDDVGGWNLVGFPSSGSVGLPMAVEENGVSNSAYNLVYAYHAADDGDHWKIYDTVAPDFANDLVNMTPGYGYWIFVIGDPVWNVNYQQN